MRSFSDRSKSRQEHVRSGKDRTRPDSKGRVRQINRTEVTMNTLPDYVKEFRRWRDASPVVRERFIAEVLHGSATANGVRCS